MAVACALAIISGKIFLIEQCRSVCGRSGIAFSREGVVTANGSCRACFLRKRRCGGKVFAAFDTFRTKGNGVRPLSQSLWLCQLSQWESQEHCRNLSLCTQYFSIEVNGLAPPLRKDFPAPGEDVTAGDKRGNLARERMRGRAFFHRHFSAQIACIPSKPPKKARFFVG